jgi:hypothetical protein
MRKDPHPSKSHQVHASRFYALRCGLGCALRRLCCALRGLRGDGRTARVKDWRVARRAPRVDCAHRHRHRHRHSALDHESAFFSRSEREAARGSRGSGWLEKRRRTAPDVVVGTGGGVLVGGPPLLVKVGAVEEGGRLRRARAVVPRREALALAVALLAANRAALRKPAEARKKKSGRRPGPEARAYVAQQRTSRTGPSCTRPPCRWCRRSCTARSIPSSGAGRATTPGARSRWRCDSAA